MAAKNRTSRRSGAAVRRRLGESRTIEDDTPILPYAVADSVINEVERYTGDGIPDSRKLADQLHEQANAVYRHDDRFRRQMRAAGDRGRDQLYVWMRHWLSSRLKREHPAIFRKLPDSFLVGHPLPEGHAASRPRHGNAQDKQVTAARERVEAWRRSTPIAPRFRLFFDDGRSVMGPVQGSGGFVGHLKGAFGMLSATRLAHEGRDTGMYEPKPGHIVVFPKWSVHDNGPRRIVNLRRVVEIRSVDTNEGTVKVSDYLL